MSRTQKKPLKGILRNSKSSFYNRTTGDNFRREPQRMEYSSIPVRENYNSDRIHVEQGVKYLGRGDPTMVDDVKYSARITESPRHHEYMDRHIPSPRRRRRPRSRTPRRSIR